MLTTEAIAVFLYTLILLVVALLSYKRHQTSSDFIIGARSLNFWLVAFAANSSDMSSWLLMGYPALIFTKGLFNAWLAIGLIIFMFLNWHFVAPRLRVLTERYNSLTLSSYFESRFADTSGLIRFFTALMQLVFYAFYITAGLVSMGLLINTLFGVNYHIAITCSVAIIVPYLFIGGYRTLAWTDCFQAIFMLIVVLLTPLIALKYTHGFAGVSKALSQSQLTLSLFPSSSFKTIVSLFFLSCSWGLGYFGQPHILTKYMGIKEVSDMRKSKYVGMSWQILTLGAATAIGLIGVAFFPEGVPDPQLIFVDMARTIFFPLLAAFILCAILAATISTMDSQILVLASSLTEDFYKRILRKRAGSKELLLASRLFVVLAALISYGLAYFNHRSIFTLVEYAWFGLGSSFGPLVIVSLFAKKVNKYGAWAGILAGGSVAGLWPLVETHFSLNIPTLIPGFLTGLLSIFVVSSATQHLHRHTSELTPK